LSERARLPNRRLHVTESILDQRGKPLTVGMGFDDEGRCREIFVDGDQSGSDREYVLDDAATIASIALQHGAAVTELAAAMGWASEGEMRQPTSPLGRAMAVAAETEARDGRHIAGAQRLTKEEARRA
jgi:hypothetical protein